MQPTAIGLTSPRAVWFAEGPGVTSAYYEIVVMTGVAPVPGAPSTKLGDLGGSVRIDDSLGVIR